MKDKYFIRFVGVDLWEKTPLMTKKKAESELRRIYHEMLREKDISEEDKFYPPEIDMEKGFFCITGEEYYQEARILKENTATGIAYDFEEIRRQLQETEAVATKYQYDLTEMAVGDLCVDILSRVNELEKKISECAIDLLTPEQLEAAYLMKQSEDDLDDARVRLYEWAGFYEGDEEAQKVARAWFKRQFWFTIDQAVNPKSKYYVLQRAAVLFREYDSVETAELGTWENALQDVCYQLSPKKK